MAGITALSRLVYLPACSYTSDATRFNTPVWVERFQKEFNPKGLANPGFPYFGDRQAEVMPGIITKEEP